MDELELNLKVTANTQAIEDIQSQLDKLKKSTKETSDGFGIADTQLGKLWNTLKEGVEKGVQSFQTLQGAIAATGIGLLVIAVASLIQYFKSTNEGANTMKGIMAALGQVIREGPIVAFNALKILFNSVKLGIEEIELGWLKLKSVFDKSDSMKAQVADLKKEIDKTKQAIVDEANAIANSGKNMAEAYKLAKQWEEIQQKIQADRVKEEDIETKIAELRDKAQEVKASDLSADEKATKQLELLNQAKILVHQKDAMALQDAQAALAIAQQQLVLAPKDTEAIKKVQDAEIEVQKIKQEGANADKAISRQMLGAHNELIKSKEEEAKVIAEMNEKTLEDTLKGRDKELAAEDFKYEQNKIKYKNNAKELEALEIEHKANILAINKKFDEEEAKGEDALMAELEKSMQEDAKKNIEDFKGTKDEELKVLETYLQQGLIDQNLYDKTVQKLTQDQAKAQEQVMTITGQKFEAQQKKQLDTLNTSLKKGLISQEQYNKAVNQLKENETKMVLKGASDTLDAVSDALGKGTIAGKAASIASTTIKTYESAEGAYSSMIAIPIVGPILAPIAAAAAVVLGLKNIAQIAGVQPPAKQKLAAGGYIGGNQYTGDNVPVMANSGEYVVNNQAMQNPQIAQAVMNMNANPNGGASGGGSISEERIAEIAAHAVKAIPVQVTEHQITLHQNNVAVREARFSVV